MNQDRVEKMAKRLAQKRADLATLGPFVCLANLPQSTWVGLPVFHPHLQIGPTPYWMLDDYPELHRDEEDGSGASYDVGVVVEVVAEAKDDIRVRFVGVNGCSLHYVPSNLFVPGVSGIRL